MTIMFSCFLAAKRVVIQVTFEIWVNSYMNNFKCSSYIVVFRRVSLILLTLSFVSGIQLLVASRPAQAQSQNAINNAACPPTSQGKPCKTVPVPVLGLGLIGLGMGLVRKRKTFIKQETQSTQKQIPF